VRALVTGSAGFVGRHMVAELEARGWHVEGVDLADGLDALDLFALERRRFDLVVHAAASSPHRAAIDGEPVHMARNLHLDAAMFDWAVRTGQGRVLYLSTSAAYPVRLQGGGWEWEQPRRLFETDISSREIGEPDAGYGWVKLTGERVAEAARAAGLPVTVVRPFSGYGEDQSANFPFRALTDRAARRDDPFVIWGDGQQVRDWIHIDDFVAGALAVVESGTELCTGIGTSMLGLVELACEQAGYRPRIELLRDKPVGVAYRVGDPTRMCTYYQPTVTLAEGVRRALAAVTV
jgi:nucleoside-diphosphate-sugar epimerase